MESASGRSLLAPEDKQLLENGPHALGSVSAATLDVYGMELAKMDLLATREDKRNQGHCRWGEREGEGELLEREGGGEGE
jgi:hypothetical protein